MNPTTHRRRRRRRRLRLRLRLTSRPLCLCLCACLLLPDAQPTGHVDPPYAAPSCRSSCLLAKTHENDVGRKRPTGGRAGGRRNRHVKCSQNTTRGFSSQSAGRTDIFAGGLQIFSGVRTLLPRLHWSERAGRAGQASKSLSIGCSSDDNHSIVQQPGVLCCSCQLRGGSLSTFVLQTFCNLK